MLVIGLLLGALLGGTLMESFNGVWLGAALGVLLARSLRQGRRLTELSEQLKALEARWEASATPPPERAKVQPAANSPPASTAPAVPGLALAAHPIDAARAEQRTQAAPAQRSGAAGHLLASALEAARLRSPDEVRLPLRCQTQPS